MLSTFAIFTNTAADKEEEEEKEKKKFAKNSYLSIHIWSDLRHRKKKSRDLQPKCRVQTWTELRNPSDAKRESVIHARKRQPLDVSSQSQESRAARHADDS
jgi:hypothetical protein